MKWLTRHRETIIPFLVVAVVAMTLANLLKHGYLAPSQLAANKDALAALNSAVTIVVVLVGSVFSYYRFFRGRTFITRAEVTINVAVIPATEDFHLHAVIISLKNIGSVSIWELRPLVTLYEYGPDGTSSRTWDNWNEARSPIGESNTVSVIDSGETISFVSHTEVPRSSWAVIYSVFIHSDEGQIWKHCAIVPNMPQQIRHNTTQ
jgi:hypothetical protein